MGIKEMIARQQEIVEGAKTAGRNLTEAESSEFARLQREIELAREEEGAKKPGGEDNVQQALQKERQRISDIMELSRQVGMDCDEYIRSGADIAAVRQEALDYMIAHGAPLSTGIAEENEANKFRAAAVDALLMRAGTPVEKPSEEADKMRNLSMRDLLITCMHQSGEGSINSLLRASKDEAWDFAVRQFFNPTAAFPAILDEAIKKNIVHRYQHTPVTFEAWTSKGTLPDFKPSKEHNYQIGGGQFEPVSEGGELKQSNLATDMEPLRKLGTYGTQFTMTRQAFINDDIGFLSEMPAAYATAAKRKINRFVYEIMVKNPAVYDGVALFDATSHKNLVTTGAAPTIEGVQKMMQLLLSQTDPFGESIMVQPRFVIVPVGYGFTLAQIFESATVNTAGNTQAYNALYKYRNQIQLIEEGMINQLAGTGAAPWFVVGDPATAKSIQVDYLNGVETPTFRRSEKAGYLGFIWDIFLDFGVSVVDYRGAARNSGVVLA